MGHCCYVNVSYNSFIIQATSITTPFLSEDDQLYYCMLPQCSCFTNTLHAHPTIHFCAYLHLTYPFLRLYTSEHTGIGITLRFFLSKRKRTLCPISIFPIPISTRSATVNTRTGEFQNTRRMLTITPHYKETNPLSSM